jgi:aldose 1-epimerase
LFSVHHIVKSESHLEYLELYSPNKDSYAKIHLSQGGSLQVLTLNGHEVIKDMSPMTYDETYASAILFPFANRIKDGRYEFEGNSYQFDINEPDNNNALHGLVYNKTFEVVREDTTETSASVKLVYHENNTSKGFPYTYAIYLEYVLTESTLDLNVEIKNTDSNTFPFTLGWHPYFFSADLFNSHLIFDCNKKVELDERNIAIGKAYIENVDSFKIGDQFLDDCFILESKTILFLTPSYILELKTTEEDCFLQLYTPPHANTIAIEPTTGISDSFNNGDGLKILKPNDTYKIAWTLALNNN